MASNSIYVTASEAYQQSRKSRKVNDTIVSNKLSGSTRMIGMPHQLLEHNDPRLGIGSDLGRVFAQTSLLEAPTICIKPGKARFLPGQSKDEKKEYFNAIISAGASRSDWRNELAILTDENQDTIQLYDHQGDFSTYIKSVTLIAQVMAQLLGVDNERVPWDDGGGATFGKYNWAYYKLESRYSKLYGSTHGDSLWSKLVGCVNQVKSFFENDNQYIRFYVDASASWSSSMSNSSSQSVLESYTEKIEGLAKELSSLNVLTGEDITGLVDSTQSEVDNFIQNNPLGGSDNPLSTLISRLSSGAKQIITGGNYILPEIWSDSAYDKNSYSFSMTLVTPYGAPLAWYLNIGVPICFLLGLALPRHLTANAYKSPPLLKVFSQGWFNCQLGLADNISIEAGSDAVWSAAGLPNEVKVSISIKDLYSNLSMPTNMGEFMSNPGMTEFLMVTCGLDITNQALDTKFKVWVRLLENTVRNYVTTIPYTLSYKLRDSIASKFTLLK